jgi:RES domain-containing protein
LRQLAEQPLLVWHGHAWRAHRRVYDAIDASGSLRVDGRYHRAPQPHVAGPTWQALYLALAPETCLGEMLRHVTPALLPRLNDLRLTELEVTVEQVVDARQPEHFGVPRELLWHDTDRRLPQQLARFALERGAGGLLVPSSTRLGDILVILPANLTPAADLRVLGSRDPRLYILRG